MESINIKENAKKSSFLSITEEINDDYDVFYYKNTPVFINFLNGNYQEDLIDKNIMKELQKKKWKYMPEIDKVYFLFNKLQYYNHIIKIKEESRIDYEKKADNKSQEIKELQIQIRQKEEGNKLNPCLDQKQDIKLERQRIYL